MGTCAASSPAAAVLSAIDLRTTACGATRWERQSPGCDPRKRPRGLRHPALSSGLRHRSIGSPSPPDSSGMAPFVCVATAGRVYPVARIAWTVDDQHRERLLRCLSVPAQHLAVGRGPLAAGLSDAERAVVQSMESMEARRRQLARMGNSESMHVETAAAVRGFTSGRRQRGGTDAVTRASSSARADGRSGEAESGPSTGRRMT